MDAFFGKFAEVFQNILDMIVNMIAAIKDAIAANS